MVVGKDTNRKYVDTRFAYYLNAATRKKYVESRTGPKSFCCSFAVKADPKLNTVLRNENLLADNTPDNIDN